MSELIYCKFCDCIFRSRKRYVYHIHTRRNYNDIDYIHVNMTHNKRVNYDEDNINSYKIKKIKYID